MSDLRERHQPRLRRTARHRLGGDLRPGRLRLHARVGRLHRVRLPRHRAPGRASRRPIDDPALPAMAAATAPRCSRTRCGSSPTRSGIELDDVRCEAEFAADHRGPRPRLVVDPPPGCVAGVAASWQGWVGDRKVVDLKVRWRKGQRLDPDWKVDEGYLRRDPGPAVRAHQARDLPGRPTSWRRPSTTSWCSA